MKKPLWKPSASQIKDANITRFIKGVNQGYGTKIKNYSDLYQWSIDNIPDFWTAMWKFANIKASKKYEHVIDDVKKMPGAKWFDGARLNFAENLLRFRDERTALIFHGETSKKSSMTYAELYRTVARLARSLKELGIKPGDRIAGYMPNMMETAIAMLATTSIGAVWSSCATDIGPKAALDRLGQIEPKVLFTVDGYFYKGKVFSTLENAAEVARGIPSIKKVVVAHYAGDPGVRWDDTHVQWNDFLSKEKEPKLEFELLPFDHPVYIMFSSGTTGKPKCMVQSSGGILINHLKELLLHTDLKRSDRILYITTCSWMMWNWMISSLGVGATVVLFDGNPAYPDDSAIWRLIHDEKITIFGTSASYINHIKDQGLHPGKDHDLSHLREISQTGSPLSAEGFEYVYREIKKDLHFNSIAGGTDINGCFAAGNIISPVYAGELQGPALAMDIRSYDENGKEVCDREAELVCLSAAPSMPLYFWNDPDGTKYKSAYFETYPNIWRHGDFVIFHKETGGISFRGRSDMVLKPSGVRIGTAEIYNVVEKIEEVADSLVVGQDWKGDQRVILFIKLRHGKTLDTELNSKIRKNLKEQASPRHVPALIFDVPDIPYTMNMKKVESSVSNIVNGRKVTNRDALRNPECLEYYEKLSRSLPL